ncbi:acetylornithine deacetylase/succinyl-diaminopimelate desuccinylase-like protein [Antricoccus suffuscus]|uniref:Acetylornithine deacetylase/succinyl-diaminopimelate desuccinylase-like protein n=1 Tax=Antricoccus suffuscus TaxID=1629062 RepID=A0A2T0ZYX4_9ACTN|nr:dipeptidase [Antricoccus suffuscus]PRZ41555.1 acetylornithine deacetylase/succinyl-diaminopimelate desuccinylase-like protein [Antricoccus suffuscus]
MTARLDDLRTSIHDGLSTIRGELAALVAIRSIADPRQAPPEECRRAAEWVRDAFQSAGVGQIELIDTSDGSTAVVGHQPGPTGTPTVLLYSHYDVQPAGDESLWASPPFELSERDGRWYGRGAADCKGNIAMHLLALRALGEFPVGVRVVSEGSEEMGGGGLEDLVRQRPELFEADVILIADTGNSAIGTPTVTTSLRGIANLVVHLETMTGEIHSGMYGGPAPDALAAMVQLLSTLRNEDGDTAVDGLDSHQIWDGVDYPEAQFRADAGVLDGVDLVGAGSVADRVWARPAATVLGIDCPPVVGSAAAIQPRASARINLRVPPGMDPQAALDALSAHLKSHAPWGARVTVEPEAIGAPFSARTSGPAYATLGGAMEAAYGKQMVTAGQGGSIPLCNVLADQFPEAEIALIGVEEPTCRIHAPNESVDPGEIENLAVAEALFLEQLGA